MIDHSWNARTSWNSRQLIHYRDAAFCLCCVGGAAFAATGGWLTPRQAYAEARGLVSLIKDSAATSPITTHKLRNNISVLEGSGGNIAVLTGPDGKVLVDAGIGVSRPSSPRRSPSSAPSRSRISSTRIGTSITPMATNGCMQPAPKIIAHENTRKHLSGDPAGRGLGLQFPAPLLPAASRPRFLPSERGLKLNGATIALKYYGARPYRQRHLGAVRRGQHPARRRHLSGTASIRSSTIRPAATSTGSIAACEANLATAKDDTIIIPGPWQAGQQQGRAARNSATCWSRSGTMSPG